jgi:hypothetical protein
MIQEEEGEELLPEERRSGFARPPLLLEGLVPGKRQLTITAKHNMMGCNRKFFYEFSITGGLK